MKIICNCGEVLDEFELGVNGSLYCECDKCGKAYNIVESEIEEVEEDEKNHI